MFSYMAHHSPNRELNDWLNRHGYRHSHASKQATPHPYAISPRTAHAHIAQYCLYEISPNAADHEGLDEELDEELDASPPYEGATSMAHARIIRQAPTGRPVFAAHERDHYITTAGRRALKRSQFALPPGPQEKRRGIKGRLPIDNLGRARSALARASMMHHQGHITAKQLEAARQAVHRAWPAISAA